MKNLTTAIWGKLSGSALASRISNRLYKGQAPDGATYPYSVFFIVSGSPDPVFQINYEDITVQFSLFSSTSGSTEVEDMFTDLKALYDDCTLTPTSETVIYMKRVNYTGANKEDHITLAGTQSVWAIHADYGIFVKV